MGTKETRPFGLRDKLGYMFGDFGNDFTFILSSSFLMKFYTDVMGVSGGVVGMIMMLARFVDAVTDVTMGRICDRSKMTPVGKFKPWIRRMCAPVAIASFLIYQSGLANMPMAFKIGYLFVTYILWGSIFYTSINIPYGSMASAISPEPGDRQSLSTFRTMGGMLAGLIIGAGVPMVAYDQVGGNAVMNGERFTMIAGVFSVCAVGCYLLCYALTTERVKSEATAAAQENNSVAAMLKNAVKNRALISIIAASIVMLLAQLTMQSMANYVYPNFYGNTTAQSVSTMMMMVGMLVAGVFAKPCARKFGKAEVSIVSNLMAAVICVLLFILRPDNVWVYVAFQMLCWLGLGMFSMVSWALITDVIDYSEIKNGIREDGSVYALYSFARKLGQAASAGLSGLLLEIIGYSAATAFDTDVVNGIFTISTLVPGLGFLLLGLILWFWYPLHKKQVDENVEILKKKHGN
ncbi:MAG: glycoside-pentoside-hexuronide (GPH):cation symporter [Blautia sp.]|nr:glycoside-pentoside-hexuronide (GPH):cation symporter [Lachnoclostridium sp.]MCM1211187.1 glycoside-pentoside-hexuronide (GPH):cation symporter [Blautia sp.]